MAKLSANSGDLYQILLFMASDLGFHYLPITLLGVARLKCIIYVLISPFLAKLTDIVCDDI